MSFLFCVIVPVPVPFMQARLYAYCYLIFIHKDTNTEIFLWNGRILLEWRWWLLSLSLLSLLRSFTSLILSFFSPVQLVMFVPTIELFQLVWSVCSVQMFVLDFCSCYCCVLSTSCPLMIRQNIWKTWNKFNWPNFTDKDNRGEKVKD